MQKKLLIVAVIICAAFAACGPNNLLSNLDSGSVGFSVNTKSSDLTTSTYTQNFQTPFQQTPAVALTLQSFNINSPIISEWSVFAQSVSQNQVVVAFKYQPSSWTSIQVGYWASSRPDILVGATTAEFGSLKSSSAPVIINLATPLPNPSSLIARAFITGYTTKSSTQIFIRAFDKSISANRIELGVQVVGGIDISSARINYVVFSPSTANFASYGGGISETNFVQSKVYNLQKFIHNSPYALFGLANIRQSAAGVTAFTSSITKDFYLRVDSLRPFQQFFISYLIIGVSPASVCSNCDGVIISQNSCVDICPPNSYVVTYKDGGRGCRKCPVQFNMIVNSKGDGCTCRQNYIEKNGLCIVSALANGATASIINQQLLTVRQTITPTAISASSKGINNAAYAYGQNIARPIPSAVVEITGPSQQQIPIPNSLPIIRQTSVQPPTVTPPIPNQVPPQKTTSVPSSDQYYVPDVNIINQNTQIPAQNQPQTPSAVQQKTSTPDNCKSQLNTYWTGYRCACKVGYALSNGACVASQPLNTIFRPAQFIYKISLLYQQQPSQGCSKPNEIFNGQFCDCETNYERDNDGNCNKKQTIPKPHIDDNDQQHHKPNNNNNCGPNSYRNGLGPCVCSVGYVFSNGRCVLNNGKNCPPYSNALQNGDCICNDGYSKHDGVSCSLCPAGQVFVLGKCIITCGVNQVVNSATKKCECQQNYAFSNGVCTVCPQGQFIFNGYCVTCPVYSQYDAQKKTCVCQPGFSLNNGICQDQCQGLNQVFSVQLNRCVCFNGLALINGVCQLCTNGFVDPKTQQCINSCRANEIFQGRDCVCQSGYGKDLTGLCTICTNIPNTFLANGFCVTCPIGQVVSNNACVCPDGKILLNGLCSNKCPKDQLIDGNGFCYSCPINQIPIGNNCQCRNGFIRINGVCQVSCPPDQNIIRGVCGTCVLGTIYNPTLNQCVCPASQYMNNQGFCTNTPSTNCQPGYFLQNSNCMQCPFGCKLCTSATTCTICQNEGFQVVAGVCQPKCGDGVVIGTQICDDGNSRNGDGCSSTCQVQPNFSCIGNRPSFCQANRPQPPNPQPPNPQPPAGNNLVLIGTPRFNFNNVLTILKTPKSYPGLTDYEKKNFIKYSFPDRSSEPTSVYCLQDAQLLDRFQCLMFYPSGLPNKAYTVNFSYSFNGDSGFLPISINPFNSSFKTRSLN